MLQIGHCQRLKEGRWCSCRKEFKSKHWACMQARPRTGTWMGAQLTLSRTLSKLLVVATASSSSPAASTCRHAVCHTHSVTHPATRRSARARWGGSGMWRGVHNMHATHGPVWSFFGGRIWRRTRPPHHGRHKSLHRHWHSHSSPAPDTRPQADGATHLRRSNSDDVHPRSSQAHGGIRTGP